MDWGALGGPEELRRSRPWTVYSPPVASGKVQRPRVRLAYQYWHLLPLH
jgi:hypothetical protein